MAPPASRRSGTNKKAQLGVFTGYVLAGAGALLGAALLVISIFRPETFGGLRSVAADAASPVGVAGATGRTSSQSVFDAIAAYYRAGSRNAELEKEVRIARVRLAEADAIRQENARLKGVLKLVENDAGLVTTTRLIGSTSSSARRYAYISAGRNQGVLPGMPVVSPMGLVGRVVESGRVSSRILLLTDSESTVPVRRATDNLVAFAEGNSDGSLRIRLINLGINPLKKGDIFVTSGAGGLFRPGIAVAVVTEIKPDGAVARVISNPAATDYVVVEPIWQASAVEALSDPEAETVPLD